MRKKLDAARDDAAKSETLEAEVDRLQKSLKQLEADLAAAKKAGAAAPAASGGVPAALTELLDELYGVVSSLKPDLRTIADAVPLLASDEEDERSEGSEMLRDGLNACTDRSNEIRTLVGKIRDLK